MEAIKIFGWSPAGFAVRLRKHHWEIPKLRVYREAVAADSPSWPPGSAGGPLTFHPAGGTRGWCGTR